jgi:hypothetical protein
MNFNESTITGTKNDTIFTSLALLFNWHNSVNTSCQGLSLNRSQYGGCSTKYNTPAGTQVVYRWCEDQC